MKPDRFTGRTAVAVSVGCAGLLALTVVALAKPELRASLGFAPVNVASYAVGQRADLPASAYESSPYTLVLFARSDCQTCRKNAPFFKALAADMARLGGPPVRLVMDVSDDRARADSLAYALSVGLDRADLLPVDLAATRVKRVPTLVLIDRSGLVRSDWESPMPQDEILRAMALVRSPR